MSYQWSIWYVPREYKDLMMKYKFQHIPHVTVQTNIPVKPTKKKLCKWKSNIDSMSFIPELVLMENEKGKKLKAIGWNVINSLPDVISPHLSYLYFKETFPFIPECSKNFPHSLSDWNLYIADTRDEDWRKWIIIDII